jgi:hypothetical protein
VCCSSKVFPSCLFISLVIDTHILNPTHVISFAFDNFVSQLVFMGLFVQPWKCLFYVPFGLPLGFVPLVKFYWPPYAIKILGILFDFFFCKRF